jgi:catechol 2,3-dioxygenase-like lactoylglutathione lyase family enzyme
MCRTKGHIDFIKLRDTGSKDYRSRVRSRRFRGESIMIDHVGFSVSDYARSKAFYEKALLPLWLLTDHGGDRAGNRNAGRRFRQRWQARFWIGGEGMVDKPLHIAIAAKDRASVDAFYRAALAAGGKDNGPPGGAVALSPELLRGVCV